MAKKKRRMAGTKEQVVLRVAWSRPSQAAPAQIRNNTQRKRIAATSRLSPLGMHWSGASGPAAADATSSAPVRKGAESGKVSQHKNYNQYYAWREDSVWLSVLLTPKIVENSLKIPVVLT